ncbi:hypothetical protein QZH41_008747 [Actinostola sp. cb2023]|nr:hypothetical protein QZH41_008747 [Actinostola sp. cb2023]
MAAFTKCLILVQLFATTFVAASLDTEYTNSAYLDEKETFKLHWKIDDTKKEISFAVQVKTLGWVGFGISAGTGNMVGSDVVIGWVKDNKGYLKDRYAEQQALPPIDEKQDYKLTDAYEKNGETVLKFTRKYDTCDDKDRKIEQGTVRVVYAYHENDPTSETNIPKHAVRGSRSLILLNVLTKKPSLPSDIKHFDIRVNTSLSNKRTTYYCKPFRIPDLGSKKHVVKIAPIVSPGNEGLVHHILIYGCSDDFPLSNLSAEGVCNSPNMPGSFGACAGQSVVAAWAIGGSSFFFPDHVGYPLGSDIGPKFVLFEVHYDNQDEKSGLKDQSGLRFYYTPTLRQYDADILWVGWGVTSRMLIPPHQQQWDSVGYCSANCTRIGFQNSTLPGGGIKVFASLLHSHLLGIRGVGLWTKHVRNGKELPEIARDDHYDFNYQV